MGTLINTGLVVFGVLGLAIGISHYRREKYVGGIRWFILFLGIFTFVWCASYGAMGFTENLKMAYVYRNIGLFGLLGFMCTEAVLLLTIVGLRKPLKILCASLYMIGALSDLIIFGQPDTNFYIRTGDRTSYYSIPCFQREYHYVFLGIFFVSFILMDIFWFVKKKPKRELAFQIEATIGNLILALMAIPDTVLPTIMETSVPTSGIGGFLCLFIIWRAANETNTFNITIKNLGTYIYETVNTAIVLFDQYGKLEMANNYATDLLGECVVKGCTIEDIFELGNNTITDGEIPSKTFRATTKAGHITCEIDATTVMDRYKEVYCVIYVIHDMTETEKLIREANEANRAKSDFLANMSHEIRTPINAILGLNEIIMKETEEEAVLDYSSQIVSAGRSLLSIVNDVLDLSRIESGKIEITPQPYKLRDLVNECYNLISIKAYDKSLDLKIDIDETLPSGYIGDGTRIRQVMVNLLSNAVKYTPKGTVRMKITGYTKDSIFYLKTAVIDTGIGIRNEDIAGLFESFKRIDEVRNRRVEGTGLGLSISKSLVDMMDGELSVTSVYGEGSTFTFVIPQQIEDMTPIGRYDPRVIGNRQMSHVSSFEAPDARILVVDDVDTNLVVFCGLLKKTKIKIDMASDGFEAIRLAEKTRYDIIFMDHMMPEMDGVETMRRIKADKIGANRKTPVVMLTANAIYGVKEEYLKQGFDDYISKPLRGEVLEEMVRKYLEKSTSKNLLKVYTGEEKLNAGPDVYSGLDIYNGTDGYLKEKRNESSIQKFEDLLAVPDESRSEEESEDIKKIRADFGDLLDIDTALMYSGNDPELFMEIVKSYRKNDLTEKLERFYDQEDYENYRIKVHSLKSSSLNIGAINMSKLATEMDAAIKKGDTHYVILNNENLMNEYKKIIGGLSERLGAADET